MERKIPPDLIIAYPNPTDVYNSLASGCLSTRYDESIKNTIMFTEVECVRGALVVYFGHQSCS